jgi:Fuc2NAc and GlcNAc transferase
MTSSWRIYLVALIPLAVAFVLTAVMRRISLARGLLDVPNARSSHATPTPRGGGVAIVLGSFSAFSILWALNVVDFELFMALTGGGLAVAAVGLIDDRRPLPAGIRLVVHVFAAVWALAWLARSPQSQSLWTGGAFQVVALLAIVWVLNLYNFMDGIDGIAASEAVFVSWGGGLLLLLAGKSFGVAAMALSLGSACLGFLVWNWPPARIFMGDVGSGYLGYVLALLALAGARESPATLWVWLILGGVFFVDATLTLARRLLRGERVYQAHRSHAYQWLARRWHSHKRVTLTVLAVNFLWLLPCATYVVVNPRRVLWATAVALLPVLGAAVVAGGGRSETR